MAITGADKIFLDVDDEINFVVEKILASERDRVILVVPQNAIVISSLVSMKILAKQITKSKKHVILVTEDAFGLGLAERSGIIAINKVSNIQPEMWEAAQIAKEGMRTRAEDTKKRLLTDRGIIEPETQPAVETEVEAEDTDANSEPEATPEVEPDTAAAPAVLESEPPEPEIVADEEIEEVTGAINRPRRDPKVVHIAGFEILAGGDIARLSADKEEMIGDSEQEEIPEDMDEEDSRSITTTKPKPTGGFTGRDWTNYTRDKKSSFSLKGLLPGRRPPTVAPGERRPLPAPDSQQGMDKRKLAVFVLVALVLMFAGAGYVLAFQLNSVEIKISLQTQQIPVQQAISADTAVTVIDKEKLVIPAKLVIDDQLSISASDKATGEGKKGDKAAGLIDLWNFTDAAVTIKNGTVVQNTTTNLKYVIQTTADIVIPAATSGGGGGSVTGIGQVQDVRVVAETFGEQFNITESGTKVDFQVDGHPTADLIGKRFNKIEGGNETTFVSVSQENFDKVKKTLSETLEKQGANKINNAVPAGYRLIDGTQKFEETESSSDPKVGEKADNFSVSLKGKVTALAVSEKDLQEAISILITNNQRVGSEFVINGLSDAIIGDVKRDGEKVTFTVSSSGNLQSKVTADDLKQQLAGKSIDEADEYLNGIEEIVSHKITYSPAIIPESLRRVPTDAARIKIIF